MKVAFVHDFLYTYGGAERLLEAMHRVYPDAPIYTARYVAVNLPNTFPHAKVIPIGVTQSRMWRLLGKHLTFLYPVLFESLDLSEYDVVISSSAGFAKGVITKANQKHICYCHTPPRFLYNYPGESSQKTAWYYAPFVAVITHVLRIWDFAAASRVDWFITNSQNTRQRIKKFYNRDADVLYPPVSMPPRAVRESYARDYFLIVSRLSAYKHIELAIQACNDAKRKLIIVGEGNDRTQLEAVSGPMIEFRGFIPDEELHELYYGAKALIYTARDEDFGITPVEAMAHGRPVIAHRSGGMSESIVEGTTGILFDDYSVDGFKHAIESFVVEGFTEKACIDRARDFSIESFNASFKTIVTNVTKEI